MRAKDYARGLYKHTNIEVPPIAIEPILSALGIDLVEGEVENVNGIAYKDGSSRSIIVNRNLAPELKRFSIAHELGHIVMPHSGAYRVCFPEVDARVEADADRFAIELLIPELTLKGLWPRYRDNREYRVSILAEIFAVPVSIMAGRVRSLRLK